MEKPPLGVMPRWLHEELNFDDTSSIERLEALNSAIKRFVDAGKDPKREWLIEKEQIEKERV